MRKLISVIGVALLIVLLIAPGVVLASPATASRDLPDTVAPGAEFDVDITASGYGLMGQVLETLPADFSYVSSSLDASQVQVIGNVVKFVLVGEESFTYSVTAATVEDTYTFSGIIKDVDLNECTIAGDTDITVSGVPPGVTASRDLPDTVAPGAEFDVDITASGYGLMGQVLETLPADFSYVSSSLDASQVEVTGNVVKFVLVGEESFTYTVTAATVEDTYTFSGIIKDVDLNEYAVGGDTDITVSGAAPGVTATRTLPDCIELGAEFDVDITASGYGLMGQVLETLPADFSYVSSSLDASQVEVTGNVVKFVLVGEESFTYTVTAATVEDTYTFSGIIKDVDLNEYAVGGDTDIDVAVECVPLPPPRFTGSLVKDAKDTLVVIPAGATELDIRLDATADIDLELYDSTTTFVIGWRAIISSSGSTTRTYHGDDTFAYSGWAGGDEYITADGPLSRAYTLKVYGYEAGDYVVTVSYMPGAPDETPPEITITAPDATVGVPTTIEVSATDLSGVMLIYFDVWSEEYPPEWKGEDPLAMLCTFTDEGSVTFTPGWAETYIVRAIALDNSEAHNATPEGVPVTATFVVAEAE